MTTEYETMDVVTDQDDNNSNGPVSVMKQLHVHHVTIHPLVLLSAADHYHRVARGTRKRVVGALLGQVRGGRVDATNSFAVPFEEDSRNPAVFYLDHNFLENMLAMFRKVNAKERVVGFYSTGPQIRSNDLRIYDIVERFTGNKHTATTKQPIPTYPPVFCIIDIRPDRPALPVTAYKVIEQVVVGGSSSPTLSRTFAHVSVEMGAMEAEEIGVEHLLRDVHDPTVSTTAALVQNKLRGLETLHEKLCECRDYLLGCCSGGSQTTTPNPEILANLQTILSLLPNLNNEHLVRSMIIKMNDYYMAIYLAALIRSIMALHDLINNKLRYGPDGTEYREEEAMKQAEAKIADEEKKEEDEKRSTGDNNSSSTTKKQDKKTQDK